MIKGSEKSVKEKRERKVKKVEVRDKVTERRNKRNQE